MQILLLSDIHSNFDALEAVLQDARVNFEIDEIWASGDLVGYGPDPAACLDLLDSAGAITVAGNHDLAVARVITTENFNHMAAAAVEWTRDELGEIYIDRLREMPTLIQRYGITLAHGSPRDPIWEYVLGEQVALQALVDAGGRGVVVGHTHLPAVYQLQDGTAQRLGITENQPGSIAGAPFLVNPGSVGQPRDHDPRASYAVLDMNADTVVHRRVEYDYKPTVVRILAAKLPAFLAQRLVVGS
jgi:predicted phosphodiesterase